MEIDHWRYTHDEAYASGILGPMQVKIMADLRRLGYLIGDTWRSDETAAHGA